MVYSAALCSLKCLDNLYLEVCNNGFGVLLEANGGEDELVEGAARRVDEVQQLPVVSSSLQVPKRVIILG